jgi:hypothetical protein
MTVLMFYANHAGSSPIRVAFDQCPDYLLLGLVLGYRRGGAFCFCE